MSHVPASPAEAPGRHASTSTQGSNNSGIGSSSSPLGAQDDIQRFLQRHGVEPVEGQGRQQPQSPTSPLATSAVAASAASSSTAASGGSGSSATGISSPNRPTAAGADAKKSKEGENSPSSSLNNSDSKPSSSSSSSSSSAKASSSRPSPLNKSSSSPTAASQQQQQASENEKGSGEALVAGGDFVPWTDIYDSACVPVEGEPADLWNIDDTADPNDSSVFAYPAYQLGGGLSKKVHVDFLQGLNFSIAQVPFTPCRPYLKEPPPTGLPLESFDLRVIYDAGRTGFEDNKEFGITPGTIIAGRYKITEYIGSAAFSRAVQAIDLKHNAYVCIKIVRNSKDFFDQALDEIKLLHYINCNGDPDENHVVQLYDFFYYKEHVFLVCELLRDNLYEFGKYNREHESEPYFTLPRLQKITKQILRALAYVHSLNLLHCDLKPENVLIKSYSRCEVKVIDFGSSCFTTDNLSSYIQSRCYRAPEVVLGCKYDGRIDVWSLGCMVPELATGHVLFHNDTLPQMMTRIAALVGPFPTATIREGRHTCRYVTKSGLFYELVQPGDEENAHAKHLKPTTGEPDEEKLLFYYSKPRRLEDPELVKYVDDADYVDFIKQCLTIDHRKRPTAAELLKHPWMTKEYPETAEQIATLAQQQSGASPSSSSSAPVSASAAGPTAAETK